MHYKNLTHLSLWGILLPFLSLGQISPVLEVESYRLENGMTVVLNQDTTTTQVFGAVLCKAGAKNESPDATGMAHYLEHMLFKGTDKIGTWNYEKEKVHLDSINLLYEDLAKAEDEDMIAGIQRQINEQSNKANYYAVPSDFDKMLNSLGSENVNAFTNYDMTFYYNSFPPQEIDRWLDLYYERFRQPVFRTFQTELEAVYEEKNRAMDDMTTRLFREVERLTYPNLPYGQWSILGKTEHLKKPSLITMYDFYDKYYVSENLVLILSGRFDPEIVKPLISAKFGQLEKRPAPKDEFPTLQPIEGTVVSKKRLTPIKVGVVGYQTIAASHEDKPILDVCEYLLYNYSETGLFNQLEQDNKLMYAFGYSDISDIAGAYLAFYVPKILTQSFKKAEDHVEGALDQLRNGDFSDELFNSAKFEVYNDFQRRLESNEYRSIMIAVSYNRNEEWDDALRYPEKIQQVTKEDVIRVANKYFGDNKIKLLSRTGFPKKDKLTKPGYSVPSSGTTVSSAYSEEFNAKQPEPLPPVYIDFEKDITRAKTSAGHKIYSALNPVNDLFRIEILFSGGELSNRKLESATDFMNYIGTKDKTLAQLKQAFASIGCSYYFTSFDNYTSLTLEGNDASLEDALALANEVLSNPNAGPKSHDIIVKEIVADRKFEKGYRSFLGQALHEYAVYGDQSEFLTRTTVKEIKSATPEELIDTFQQSIAQSELIVYHSGQMDAEALASLVDSMLTFNNTPKAYNYMVQDRKPQNNTTIYVVDDKKAVQSQINFHIEGKEFDQADFATVEAYNDYFGYGLSSIVFQEIREFRSLAYTARFRYVQPPIPGKKGYLNGYIGCQADKTNEALSVMLGLLDSIPQRQAGFESTKKGLALKTFTNYPSFRDLPERIKALEQKGYVKDPFKVYKQSVDDLSIEDVVDFHNSITDDSPIIISIYGDTKMIDIEELRQIGNVVELKTSDVLSK